MSGGSYCGCGLRRIPGVPCPNCSKFGRPAQRAEKVEITAREKARAAQRDYAAVNLGIDRVRDAAARIDPVQRRQRERLGRHVREGWRRRRMGG